MTETVYRQRDFTLFLVLRVFSTLAMMIQSVAVGWQVYDLVRSPLALGWVGLAEFVPMFLLTLPAGALVDRSDQRRVLAYAYVIQALTAVLLAGLTLLHVRAAWPFYVVVGLFGCARGFYGPAAQSLLPFLVPPERLPRAIATNASLFQAAVIVGPALGGLAYGLGPQWAYGLCALSYGAAAVIAAGLGGRRRPPLQDEGPGQVEQVKEGLRYVRSRPVVLGAISLDLFAVLLGGAAALLPVFARDILHAGPLGLGVLRSAQAVGATLVALLLLWRPIRRHTGLTMFGAVAVFGVATIVFGLSRNFWLSLGALAVLGVTDQISVFIRANLIQLATPDAMRGRVSAVNMLFIGASNELGEFESGVTASWWGTVPAVVIGGLGTLAVVVIWMRVFRELRQVDRLESVQVPQ